MRDLKSFIFVPNLIDFLYHINLLKSRKTFGVLLNLLLISFSIELLLDNILPKYSKLLSISIFIGVWCVIDWLDSGVICMYLVFAKFNCMPKLLKVWLTVCTRQFKSSRLLFTKTISSAYARLCIIIFCFNIWR